MKENYIMLLFVLAGFIDFILAVSCLKLRNKRSSILAYCLLSALLVCILYSVSVLAPTKFMMSLFSSMYFCTTDALVIFLFVYTVLLVGEKDNIKDRFDFKFIVSYGLLDMILMMVNPFKEIAVEYYYVEDAIAHWRYHSLLLHNLHMTFTYLLVAYVLYLMFKKTISCPKIYRNRYYNSISGLIVIIICNAIFVFLPNNTLIDFSILLYTVLGIVYCFNENNYSRRVILSRAQNAVLENLDRPVILFDYDNKFVTGNKDMLDIIGRNVNGDNYTLESFVNDLKLPLEILNLDVNKSFQWKIPNGHLYRYDFRLLKDEKAKTIGRQFVLSDISLEIDLLTEFPNKLTMEKYIANDDLKQYHPAAVIVFDLNQLAKLNNEAGREVGDNAIKYLAAAMRKHCPENSYFARLEDANLLAICPLTDTAGARSIYNAINEELKKAEGFPFELEVQSASCIATNLHPDLKEAVNNAFATLKTKKILDSTSAHASLLSSLAQAQNESDPATEEHVQRTRLFGDILGRKLGLSDQMLNELSLLCLLHDIGKLGVPLEILNKPGKLSKEEWDVMKSHVEKGYNIAMVSKELQPIADLILHHHESWDGSGYPDGLSQESIPLLSRIIAVVDAFDAMTNDRPYRKGLPISIAINELRKCAGTQFDPNIVAEFIALIPEIYPDEVNENQQITQDSKPVGALRNNQIVKDKNDPVVQVIEYGRVIIDGDLKILEMNEEFAAMSGYNNNEIADFGMLISDLIYREDLSFWQQYIASLLDSSHIICLEHRIKRKDGSARNCICYGRFYFDPVSRFMKGEMTYVDVSSIATLKLLINEERVHATKNLERLESVLRRDSLTGLLNHGAYYADASSRLLEETNRKALLVMDIDDFKKCNDSLGHLTGDELLKVLGKRLDEAVFPTGICGRVGGDEFSALLTYDKDTPYDEILRNIRNIKNTIDKGLLLPGSKWTISLGAVLSENTNMTIKEMYKIADDQLYRAKNNGKNRLEYTIL